MEAKFELASLLAHPKSMVANIFGGSMHTIQHSGWDYFKRAQKVSELHKKMEQGEIRFEVRTLSALQEGNIHHLYNYE